MDKKTIDVDALLTWAQAKLSYQSPLLYPRPDVILQASAKDFWDFVRGQAGWTPEELDANLDRLFPEKSG